MTHSEETPSTVQRFFGDLNFKLGLITETKKRMNLLLATDFNAFSYIDPDENTLSDILRDLLDPLGAHGQDQRFLKAFLATFGIDFEGDLAATRLRREDVTREIEHSDRRIDITIEFPFDNGKKPTAIGIENKPFARDQKDQVEDYVKLLRKRYGDGNFWMVYLSGEGKPAESISREERQRLHTLGRLKETSYRVEFVAWLERCIESCEADKVRWFLRDFESFVELHFTNVTDSTGR